MSAGFVCSPAARGSPTHRLLCSVCSRSSRVAWPALPADGRGPVGPGGRRQARGISRVKVFDRLFQYSVL